MTQKALKALILQTVVELGIPVDLETKLSKELIENLTDEDMVNAKQISVSVEL